MLREKKGKSNVLFTLKTKLLKLHTTVLTQCQMNENPCSFKEIHKVYEHGFKLQNTKKEHQTDYFANAFVNENVAYVYDVVSTLWRSKIYNWCHFVSEI